MSVDQQEQRDQQHQACDTDVLLRVLSNGRPLSKQSRAALNAFLQMSQVDGMACHLTVSQRGNHNRAPELTFTLGPARIVIEQGSA